MMSNTLVIVGIEIERRFLVDDVGVVPLSDDGVHITQYYPPIDVWLNYWTGGREEIQKLLDSPLSSVRIRSMNEDFYATIKGYSAGASRDEFEKRIENNELMELVGSHNHPMIEKVRHILPAPDGLEWEVDIFTGPNNGLVIAEIELPSPDHPIDIPPWVGEEITGQDGVWSNHALALTPRPRG